MEQGNHKFRMTRQFAVDQWELCDVKVKHLKAEIRELEKRKQRLWDFIAKLDEMNKESKKDRRDTTKMIVVERDKNEDKCPKCGSRRVEISLWDFRQKAEVFKDIWRCLERDCGIEFVMTIKRKHDE